MYRAAGRGSAPSARENAEEAKCRRGATKLWRYTSLPADCAKRESIHTKRRVARGSCEEREVGVRIDIGSNRCGGEESDVNEHVVTDGAQLDSSRP